MKRLVKYVKSLRKEEDGLIKGGDYDGEVETSFSYYAVSILFPASSDFCSLTFFKYQIYT